MNIDFFKTWLLPPLVGAIIGYFTNWLAIKMLFRPYREIRIAGIRLPFTPGILPRERARLAQSLGETLSQELLTPEVISRRFRSPQVQSTATIATEAALRGFLEMDAALLFQDDESSPSDASAQDALPLQEKGPGASVLLQKSVSSQKSGILDSIRSLAVSPAFQEAVRNLIDELSARIGNLKLNEILSREQFVSILRQVVNTLPAGAGGIRSAAALLIHVPPDSAVRVLSEKAVPSAYRLVLPAMKAFLRSEDFRRRLEAEGLALVKRVLERLGPMQRLFVSLAGYEARIAQTMPQTVEDLVRTIEALLDDPSVPERLAQALCGVLIEQRAALFARMNVHEDVPDSSPSQNTAADIVQAFKDSDGEFAARSAEIYDRIADWRISVLMGSAFEPGILSSAVMSAANSLLQPVPQEEAFRKTPSLGRLIKDVLRDAARGKSVARFLGIGDESIARISAALSSQLLDIVAGRMPLIVQALDIKSMVAERIDSLDMAEVERLVLQVAKRELGWITWLGGILGAMIGLLQGLVSLL